MDERPASDADDPSLIGTNRDKTGPFSPIVATEEGVLVGISPATYREIESLARVTGMSARRMLTRLIAHGVVSWHEARQAGRLTSLW